jgi:hypothetical protein
MSNNELSPVFVHELMKKYEHEYSILIPKNHAQADDLVATPINKPEIAWPCPK